MKPLRRAQTLKERPNSVNIIGTGAVASWFAHELSGLDWPLGFFNRNGPTTHSFVIHHNQQRYRYQFQEPQHSSPIVAIHVKAYDLERALSTHQHWMLSQSVVMVSCNGYVDTILSDFKLARPDISLCRAVNFVGVRPLAANEYVVSGRHPESFMVDARTAPKDPRLANFLPTLISNPVFTQNRAIMQLTQKKWLFNTTLNTFCARFNLDSNGLVLEKEEQLRALFAESFSLGQRLYPNFVFTDEAKAYQEMKVLIAKVCHNQNSMVADRRANRRTESDFLAGMAQEFDGFPLLREYHQYIKAMERTY